VVAPIEPREPRLWRLHSDATNRAFLVRALAGRRYESALKTDLFDEAVTTGVAPLLRDHARSIAGIDLSSDVVALAGERHPEIDARRADVRDLPFGDATFDLVVSLSTLDHLASVAEIGAAIGGLGRVLAPGGTLALTIDNLANPVVAARNALPGAALREAGLVAYRVGPTVGPRRLERSPLQHGRFLRAARAFEALEALPTRYLTGYFVAIVAERPLT